MATRKGTRTTRRPIRRATATRRTTAARVSTRVRKDPHDDTIAHGYIYGELKAPPPDPKAFLKSTHAALQQKIGKYPDHKPYVRLSLMEDTEYHGKQKKQRPGTALVGFVSFPNQLPPGHDVAHERIHDLAATIDPHNNAAFGLANHWCCYQDQ